jgi:hypothetical protein
LPSTYFIGGRELSGQCSVFIPGAEIDRWQFNMETTMSVLTRSRWLTQLGIGTLALLGLSVAALQPAPAQTRMLASLADVQAYVPAPYHPHTLTNDYSSALYDGYSSAGVGPHYWH